MALERLEDDDQKLTKWRGTQVAWGKSWHDTFPALPPHKVLYVGRLSVRWCMCEADRNRKRWWQFWKRTGQTNTQPDES